MKQSKFLLSIVLWGLFIQILNSCNEDKNKSTQQVNKDIIQKKSNPVVYFEVPVISNLSSGSTVFTLLNHLNIDSLSRRVPLRLLSPAKVCSKFIPEIPDIISSGRCSSIDLKLLLTSFFT